MKHDYIFRRVSWDIRNAVNGHGFVERRIRKGNAETASAIVRAYLEREQIPVLDDEEFSCYSPGADTIRIPPADKFENESMYYNSLLHELIHTTGTRERMHRGIEFTRFGDSLYCIEELTAEFGSAFLCAIFGIETPETKKENAEYIKVWIDELSTNKKLTDKLKEKIINGAIAEARNAVFYIIGK